MIAKSKFDKIEKMSVLKYEIPEAVVHIWGGPLVCPDSWRIATFYGTEDDAKELGLDIERGDVFLYVCDEDQVTGYVHSFHKRSDLLPIKFDKKAFLESCDYELEEENELSDNFWDYWLDGTIPSLYV